MADGSETTLGDLMQKQASEPQHSQIKVEVRNQT